jgi:TPR repeat protein
MNEPIYEITADDCCFRLDLRKKTLFKEKDGPVALTSQQLKVLIYLVQHEAYTLLYKRDLADNLWPKGARDGITKEAVHQAVNSLRKVLKSKGGNFIKVVPGQGYRIDAEIKRLEEPPPPTLKSSDPDYTGRTVRERADDDLSRIARSAERGDAAAQYSLGLLHLDGLGVKLDQGEAMRWFRAAADQQYTLAQVKLGEMYHYGEGRSVPEDRDEAERWYLKAAQQGDALAQYQLGTLYLESGTYGEAARWLLRAARQGHIESALELAFEYGTGRRWAPRDYVEANRWYRTAAEHGDATAQRCLGEHHHRGEGVALNYAEAMHWYRKAAAQGEPMAQWEIGNLYRDGLGVEQDYEEAMRWYHAAAVTDQVEALVDIGNLHRDGRGVVQDYAQAMRWFEKAATSGNAQAQYELGVLYANGWGTARDLDKARFWMSRSAKGGVNEAKRWLASRGSNKSLAKNHAPGSRSGPR